MVYITFHGARCPVIASNEDLEAIIINALDIRLLLPFWEHDHDVMLYYNTLTAALRLPRLLLVTALL